MWTVSPQRWSPETDRQRRWVPLRGAGYVVQSLRGLGSCPRHKIIHFWAFFITRKARLEAPEEWKHSAFFLQNFTFWSLPGEKTFPRGGNLPSKHSPWNVHFLEFNLAGIRARSGIVYRNVEGDEFFAARLRSSRVILRLTEPQPWVLIWEQGPGGSKDGFLCRTYLLIVDASQPLVLWSTVESDVSCQGLQLLMLLAVYIKINFSQNLIFQKGFCTYLPLTLKS